MLAGARQLDLSLPSQLPIVLLEPDLGSLTGLPRLRLTTLAGAPLDHDLSLADNGVRSGALVRCEAGDARLVVYDDVVDAAPSRGAADPAAPAVAAALLIVVLAAYLLSALALPVAEVLVLLAASATGWWQRAALRIWGPSPDADPREAEVLGRVAATSRAVLRGRRTLELLAIAGGLALLVRSSLWSVLAGWCCLLMIVLRARSSDPLMLHAGAGALAVALALTLQVGGMPTAAVAATAGAAALALAVTSPAAAGPSFELWRERAGVLLTVAAPALALVGSGLLPGTR